MRTGRRELINPHVFPRLFHSFSCAERLPELVAGTRVGLPYVVGSDILWVRFGESHMDWTAEAIDQLRGLWAEGHSTAEIGRRMGVSKNAVVGKAHRLNLPARPSPIRREAEGEAAARPAAAPRRPAAPPP